MALQTRNPGPLGRRLVYLRRISGLTRDDLARGSGLSRHLIQSLEQGRTRNPTLSTLIGLANGLSVELQDLFEGVIVREHEPLTQWLFDVGPTLPAPNEEAACNQRGETMSRSAPV